ncbi:hypothetical protein ABTK97_20010, partial [Acinetobacter baumannii]
LWHQGIGSWWASQREGPAGSFLQGAEVRERLLCGDQLGRLGRRVTPRNFGRCASTDRLAESRSTSVE